MMAQFKIFMYYSNLDEEPDVRKFHLDETGPIQFVDFVEKIQNLFQIFEGLFFQYVDCDGDKICVENAEEFQTSLNEQPQQPYKYYVRKKSKSNEVIILSQEEHAGVICTCCHQIIKGFRYKCVTCPNYDLCQRCESKSTHPAHDMFRIASASRIFPPHFFSRLQRFYDKTMHPQTSNPNSARSSVLLLEPMAKDLYEEDCNSDIERYLTPDENSEPADQACLPSITELTKNVQNLIDKDFDENENNKSIIIEEEPELPPPPTPSTLLEINRTLQFAAAVDDTYPQIITAAPTPEIDGTCNDFTFRNTSNNEDHDENTVVVAKEENDVVNLNKVNEVTTILPNLKKEEEEKDIIIQTVPRSATTISQTDLVVVVAESSTATSTTTTSTEAYKSSTNLTRLQDEIDKLLAPLTPTLTTPKEFEPYEKADLGLEQNITNTIITQEDNNDNENDEEVRSTVSSASSSPFELCEVTDIAIIESNIPADLSSCKLSERKNLNKRPDDDDCQKAFTISTNDKHNSDVVDTKTGVHISLLKPLRETSNPEDITVMSTEIIEEEEEEEKHEDQEEVENPVKSDVKEDSPVPPDEAEKLLKIVEDHEKQEVGKYMLASSRVMLRKQLRQETIDKSTVSDLFNYSSSRASSSNSHYNGNGDTNNNGNDYKSKYLSTSLYDPSPSMTTSNFGSTSNCDKTDYRNSSYGSSSYERSYSSRPYSTYSRSNRDDKVSEAVGQMVSMGFTDEDGWLTQLCTLKKGNIEQVLDVLTPVKK